MNTVMQKIEQSRMVIDECFDTIPASQTIVAWSGGKDSTLLLKMIIEVCRDRKIAVPTVLDIDQRDGFEEMIHFRSELVEQWKLSLVIVRNDDFLDRVETIGDGVATADLDQANQQALRDMGYTDPMVTWTPSSPVCSQLMKAVPVARYIAENDVRAMFTGIRWDEHPARRNETYFSSREKPPHVRIHPLLHLTERDVWDATFALAIPYNGLYRQGYRSIDTCSGTTRNSDTPAWEQDLEHTHERDGRDPEKERMMEQLRAWGYM